VKSRNGSTPDMDGKVVVITGSNIGIGKETAVALASMGATVVLACRNREKATAAGAEVEERCGNGDVRVVHLDLADLATVRTCADDIKASWPRLDVLINNAGGMWTQRSTTAQGFEHTFGVNHLGHFYLTTLLLDRLEESAPSRIINVASVAHHVPVRGMRWADLQTEKRRYTAMRAYSQSKLANVLFTRALALRLDPRQVTAHTLHPGPVRSGFGMDGDMKGVLGVGNKIFRLFEISSWRGARTSIHLASDPSVEGTTGRYWVRRRPGHMSRAARDAAAADRLWDESEYLLASVGFPVEPSVTSPSRTGTPARD
jgi:NAD(P)-dependent dehydrogenase (short-subunit alcohol dehydrogenase family)